MKQFFLTVAGVFFGMVLFFGFFFIVGPLAAIALFASATQQQDPAMGAGDVILELDLRLPMADQPSGPFAFAQAPSLIDLVRGLKAAEEDDHVKGMFIRVADAGLTPAQAQELREALWEFRNSGKFIVAHSQGFSSTSVIPYVSVSAADEIWLQQTADFSASGLSSEVTFLGGLIEKYDAESQILQIAEYKTAANTYNQSGFTDAHRESLTSMLGSILDQSVEMIAADRGLTPDEAEALLLAAPYSAEGAARAGLVDRVGHVVEAREAAEARAGTQTFLPMAEYLHNAPKPWSNGPTIAWIGGQGEIVTGETWSQNNLLGGSDIMGSDTVSRAFLDAAEDDNVRAIIFRIDSPGGSIVASEQIRHAVQRAKDAGKPIVVSMGGLAASGGYYVAAPADAIIAQPGTLTGSIGIYGGKIALGGTLDLVGVNLETLSVGGDYAGAFSSGDPFTPQQLAAMQAQLEDGYAAFTGHVAEGRNLPLDRVLEIAKGRVWTGEQAAQLGLVDSLGGVPEAIDKAKELAGIDPEDSVNVRSYPAPLSPFEQIRMMFGVSAESAETLAAIRDIAAMPEVQAALEARRAAARAGQAEALADLPRVR